MSTYIGPRDAARIISAAQTWTTKCMVEDGSILSGGQLWTTENLQALHRHFVQNLDTGEGSFYEKLRTQLQAAPDSAKQLMAECLWILFLFPSNISVETKREGIQQVWQWSGEALDPTHPMLSEPVLIGIGSGGMGINNHRWRELVYIIGLGLVVKSLDQSSRRALFATYDAFVRWIETVPQDGERQFRQMLRYFLFPDRVERMSSNGDRIKVLAGFDVAKPRELRKWPDEQLDAAMLRLRRDMEAKYDTHDLDFYQSPLREVWKAENEADELLDTRGPLASAASADAVANVTHSKPKNLILFGPPGTGKTYRLQQLLPSYTDQPADVDRRTWETGLVGAYGWRAVIAAALATSRAPAKVGALAETALVRAKAAERGRTGNLHPTLWGNLQSHTALDVATVKTVTRRPPFLFLKNEASEWSLVSDWRDLDGESAELADLWARGPGGASSPVTRYEFVTFHPSYSYEDFVVGLRPVAVGDGDEDQSGQTEFRMVDGVFKQICAKAKANPRKRYALFIDEINRANIAKVFGELITLVEGDKRARYDNAGKLEAGLEVRLPGTDEKEDAGRFGVPVNLDIYGTMNTADRSIALLDIALRRRFEFEELRPRYDVIDRRVDGVDLGKLLRTINDRVEYLADRERQIGHAYFARIGSLEELRTSFQLQIIPLLQEYFFDDLSRVRQVLARSDGRSPFIERTILKGNAIFGRGDEDIPSERERLTVTDRDSWTIASFQSLYSEVWREDAPA